MNTKLTLITVALAAMTATAAEPMANNANSAIRELVTEARVFEMQARESSQLLKRKQVDVAALELSLQRKGESIARLQNLASQYEAGAPELTAAQKKDWELAKTKLKLMEMFHSTKSDLAAKGIGQNRALLRAHANGLAQRAAALQKTLLRMNP